MSPTTMTIDEQAAQWTVRIDAGPLGTQEQAELDAWLAASPLHHGAYIRSRAAWVYIDRVASLAGRRTIASEGFNDPPPRPNRRDFIAAGTATLLLGGTLGWFLSSNRAEAYQTGVGQMRRVALSDGSHMALNTATQATVRFTRARREVQLDLGEIMFEVARDPRTFAVRVANLIVTAVGSTFSVRRNRDPAQVDIVVSEGAVQVADELANTLPRRVAENQRLIVSQAVLTTVETLSHDKAERLLAWRAGEVAFDGEPLAAAVAEVNRYNTRKIILDDPQLGARPIVGIFRATDMESFVSSVVTAFQAQAIDVGDVIRLQRRVTPP